MRSIDEKMMRNHPAASRSLAALSVERHYLRRFFSEFLVSSLAAGAFILTGYAVNIENYTVFAIPLPLE